MLTLICGIPNAGKTTYSLRYAEVIHLDDYQHGRKWQEQLRACNDDASKVDGDVVVEGIYNTKEQRKGLLMACWHQTPKVCIWLDTPLDECIKRERNYRKRPISSVIHHDEIFQEPALDEGWDEVIRIGE